MLSSYTSIYVSTAVNAALSTAHLANLSWQFNCFQSWRCNISSSFSVQYLHFNLHFQCFHFHLTNGSYLWLYFLYVAVAQHQHAQGPQSSEDSGANLANIVSPQFQQPCSVWEAPGDMLEATATTVHQVRMLVTMALMWTQPWAHNSWKQGCGEVKGEKDEEKGQKTEMHISPGRKRKDGQLARFKWSLESWMKLGSLILQITPPSLTVIVDTSERESKHGEVI